MEEIKKEEQTNENELSLVPTDEAQPKQVATIWNNSEMLEKAWKSAKFLSSSDLVPQDTYREKPANCLIALDIANRTGFSPLTVMQQLYIVKGKPSWSGQMAIALVNNCGRFTPLEFTYVGEMGTPSHGCYASATDLKSGKVCVSDIVTMQMAKDEGWLDKNGSKWKTMPMQMMKYRSGAFFARTYCPEVLLGLPLADEVRDVKGYDDEQKSKVTIKL